MLQQMIKDEVQRSIRATTRTLAKELTKAGTKQLAKRTRGGLGTISGLIHNTYSGESWPKWFENKLLNERGGLVQVIGKRHSGKTSLCVSLAEWVQGHTDSPIYFPGYPKQMLPRDGHIISVPINRIGELMDRCLPGDIIILDDASNMFNSKRTMADTGLFFESFVNTIAHRAPLVFINTQDSSDLHKASLRADIMVMKPPERMYEGSERRAMRPIIKRAVAEFAKIPKREIISHAWVWGGPDEATMIKVAKPTWMDTKQAKYRSNERETAFDGGTRRLSSVEAWNPSSTSYLEY